MQVRSNLAFTGGAKATGLPQSSASGEAVVHEQLVAALAGLAWKDNVQAASTGNVSLATPGSTMDGVTLAAGRILLKNQTAQAENGIYIWAGASTLLVRANDTNTAAGLLSAVVVVDAGTVNAGTRWRQTAVNITLETTNITFVSDQATVPSASESVSGTAELATQAETDTGTDDARIVTPLKLATSPYARRFFSAAFGDGSATQYDITHNLNNVGATASVRVTATGARVLCDITNTSANVTRVNVITAPTSNELTIDILK